MHKYVKKLPSIQLVDQKTKEPMKFPQQGTNNMVAIPPTTHDSWMDEIVFGSANGGAKLGAGTGGVRRVIRCTTAWTNTPVGGYCKLDADDHQIILDILNSTVWANVLIASQFYPFMEAIEKATDEDPSAEKPAAA